MGKWAARLAEKTAAPPPAGTDGIDKRGLVSALAVTSERGARQFHAPPISESEPAVKPEALALAAGAWTEGDIARFFDRRARLLRWGWVEPEAEKLAARLAKRKR